MPAPYPHVEEVATARDLTFRSMATIRSPCHANVGIPGMPYKLTLMLKRNVRGSPTVIQFVLLPDEG